MKKALLLTLLCAFALAGCKHAGNTVTLNYATINMRYDNPDDSLNNWKYRKERMAKFIMSHQLDVFGTQELLANQADDLCSLLPDYSMVGVARDDGKRDGEYAAIFFRTARFTVLDSNTFWLCENPDSVGMKGWDAACVRIATWAKLQENATGKVFMAVNTHFDHIGTEARRQSALLIIGKIKEIVGDKPAVLTGDFNVDDQSEAYKTITTNSFKLLDARKTAKTVTGCDYTWHDFGQLPKEERSIIDFIFITPGITAVSAEIPEVTDGKYLTDHNPQLATLQF